MGFVLALDGIDKGLLDLDAVFDHVHEVGRDQLFGYITSGILEYESRPTQRVKGYAYLGILGELIRYVLLVSEEAHALGHFSLTP